MPSSMLNIVMGKRERKKHSVTCYQSTGYVTGE